MREEKPDLATWQAAAAKEVKGKDLTWRTPEGIAVKPLYTADDVADIDPGLPGFAPFTRGVRASMYAGRQRVKLVRPVDGNGCDRPVPRGGDEAPVHQ